MGYFANLITAAGTALSAFRESMLNTDPIAGRASSAVDFGMWGRWESRVTRYDLYWGLYQNNAYRDVVHPWSARFKAAYGIPKHARHLYSPSHRLGEFWANHLMGGTLDRDAGDGESVPSALPILTEDPALRAAIARLWRDSDWQVNKEIFTLWGAVLGDVAIKVVDDTARGQVRLELVHPGHLKWVGRDELGNVKGYILQKRVPDPRQEDIIDVSPTLDPESNRRTVTYHEKCYRDGPNVIYETSLDGTPYPWNGEAAAWTEPYGFVPLVLSGHKPIGQGWSENCFHAGLSRFLEVDGQASCVSDQNRKALAAPMFVAGARGQAEIKQGGVDRSRRTSQQNLNDPEPARSELGFLYGPEGSTVTPLTFAADLAGMNEHVQGLLGDIEKNYPELLADTGNLGGTVTAEAIRNARQRASAKVQARRVGYDDALVRAQQMALAIGGHRGYEGYAGFDLDSYRAGQLDHQIGHRPVFEVDPLDAINEDQAFWTAAGLAVKAGVPLPLYLERNGWSKEDIQALADARAKEPAPVVVSPPGTPVPPKESP